MLVVLPPKAPLGYNSYSLSLFLMTNSLRHAGNVYCRIYDTPLLEFVWYFFHGQTAVLGVGKIIGMRRHFHHIVSRVHTIKILTADAVLDHLVQALSVRCLPFSMLSPLEGNHMSSPHLRSRELRSPHNEWSIYINYWEFCMRPQEISLSPCPATD